MNDIVPLTKDLLDSLPRCDRAYVLSLYHDWLSRERKNDRREHRLAYLRVYNFLKSKKHI